MRAGQKTWAVYRRLLSYIWPFWPVLILGIVANMCYSGVDAGMTYFLKPFMDKSFIDKDLSFINQIPWIIFAGISIRGLMSSFGGYCMTYVARQVVKVFRQGVFKQILYLPKSYFDRSPSGQLLSKLLYDVEQVAQVSADALTTFVQSSCLIIGLLGVMFFISWQLSALFLLAVPFVGVVVSYTNRRTRKVSHAVQASMGNVTEIAGEAIDAYQIIRLYGGQEIEKEKFINATEESRVRDMKVAKIKVINVFGVQFITAIGIAVIIISAAIYLNNTTSITAGGFVSLVAAMLQLIKPLKNLSTVNSTIQRGLAGAESVFALFDSPLEQDRGKKALNKVNGELCFERVSFSYDGHSAVLSNISFTIEPGQTLALVGASGSGKTTLASLIPRFYSPSAGNIRLDGLSISELSLQELRTHIAMVSQHVVLFNDTIAANIAYGIKSPSMEMVYEAARLSYALNFIEALPEGFNTRVGENGLRLSGGQRQRIAIARAILKQAPILILDEATSALDNHSEKYIQKALEAAKDGRTTLVIAHRLSTIKNADKIIVMDKGRVVETGDHALLLAKDGHYASLYQMQFSKEELAID